MRVGVGCGSYVALVTSCVLWFLLSGYCGCCSLMRGVGCGSYVALVPSCVCGSC